MIENAPSLAINSNLSKSNTFQQFEALKKLHFSGYFRLSSPEGKAWSFFLYRGLIVYATGGTHSGRRWRRYLARYCTEIPIHVISWQQDLDKIGDEEFSIHWEYTLLKKWMTDKRITSQQATEVIKSIVNEVFFEAVQFPEALGQKWQDSLSHELVTAIAPEQTISNAISLLQGWKKAGLTDISPYQAPVIRQLKKLEQLKTVKFYQKLTHILSTRHTLWDLAVKMQRSVVDVTVALMPCAQSGIIELVDLPDLYVPKYQKKTSVAPTKQISRHRPKLAAAPNAQVPKSQLQPFTPPNIQIPKSQLKPATAPHAQVPKSQLQLITEAKIKASQPRLKLPGVPTKQGSKSGALIACIDDSLWVQKMLEKLLTSAGYQFIGVNDELRAVSILLKSKPDLIFLDLVMPKANGYEICEKLRKISRFRETPILILTGNDGYANRLRSNFAGASEFLTKPLDAQIVLKAIRKHLKQDVTN